MKLLLLSLALFGLALIAQAGTVEKREVSEEEDITIESDNSACTCKDGECNRCDDNGCEQVSSCNGKREAVAESDDAGLIFFKADNSKCKCLRKGYCMERKRNQQEYAEVTGCGEARCYTHCDSSGCREVCDGSCTCDEYGRCDRCDASGCEQVKKCNGVLVPAINPVNCLVCDNNGCKTHHEGNWCSERCQDDDNDILFEEKCSCKRDHSDGQMKCEMCGKFNCEPVDDCSRFATCTCRRDINNDAYRRCYGYNHGKRDCRTLRTCSAQLPKDEEEHAFRVRQSKSREEFLKTIGKVLDLPGRKKRDSCDCPSDGGLCKQCDFLGRCSYVKECGPGRFNVTAHLH